MEYRKLLKVLSGKTPVNIYSADFDPLQWEPYSVDSPHYHHEYSGIAYCAPIYLGSMKVYDIRPDGENLLILGRWEE